MKIGFIYKYYSHAHLETFLGEGVFFVVWAHVHNTKGRTSNYFFEEHSAKQWSLGSSTVYTSECAMKYHLSPAFGFK